MDAKKLENTAMLAQDKSNRSKSVAPLSTPYPMLDEITGGFDAGEMIVVAARPSMGKTSFLSNLAEHTAIDSDVPVAFFSLDLPREQLIERLVCSRLSIDWQLIKRRVLSPESLQQIDEMRGGLANGKLHIDNSASVTIDQLSAKARQLKQSHDIQCILVDYLQLMDHPGLTSECPSLLDRQNAMAELSSGIKALAEELQIPVIVAFQLSPPPEDRPGNRPRFSDLREARAIGEDADVLAFLHNEDYFHRGEEGYVFTGITELIVAKNTGGAIGMVPLVFRAPFLRFEAEQLGAP